MGHGRGGLRDSCIVEDVCDVQIANHHPSCSGERGCGGGYGSLVIGHEADADCDRRRWSGGVAKEANASRDPMRQRDYSGSPSLPMLRANGPPLGTLAQGTNYDPIRLATAFGCQQERILMTVPLRGLPDGQYPVSLLQFFVIFILLHI